MTTPEQDGPRKEVVIDEYRLWAASMCEAQGIELT